MRSFALASGSSGNCFYVESSRGVRILVDLGLSFKRTKEILYERGINIEDINYVFITHEHSDHCQGLKKFCESVDAKIYLSRGTRENIKDVKGNFEVVEENKVVELGDIRVFSIRKSHDSSEAFSYIFENGKKVGVFTDMGYVCDKIMHIIKGLDVLYCEASYCESILKERKLSYNYVNRLVSDIGHLSVDESSEILSKICNNEQTIVLSHISTNANTYENAYLKVKGYLHKRGIFPKIEVSFQDEPTRWIC